MFGEGRAATKDVGLFIVGEDSTKNTSKEYTTLVAINDQI
jgi:hypothetical protein